MPPLPVRAYTDSLSYERGQVIQVQVSAEGPVDISLVRLVNAAADDTSLDSAIPWINAGTYDASVQETRVGSYLVGEPSAAAPDQSPTVSFGAFVWSGDFAAARTQTLVALPGGIALRVLDGRPALGPVIGPRLADHEWHLVVASLGEDAAITVVPVDSLRGVAGHETAPRRPAGVQLTGPIAVGAVASGAHGLADDHFTGKIEDPFVTASVLTRAEVAAIARGEIRIGDLPLVAGWDLSYRRGADPSVATAVAGGQPDGVLVNGPTRGVTGRLFTGRHLAFPDAPAEYAAVHFHSTDLFDAGWETVLSAPLPDELASGVYGVVVRNEAGSDTVPFIVVPRPDDARNKVLVVLPTFTYLAYANEALFTGLDAGAMTDQDVTVEAVDQAHVGDSSFGLSMYDTHPDGSGVTTSSARRQIVNMRRGYRMWLVDAGRSFSSDMYLIEWLARRGIEADVVTDYEIHSRGAEYLAPYAAVLSGSHPEYTSEEMLDALTAYRDNGGGLLYLGGNGWYWVTGVASAEPLVVEIRRGQAGIRCWESLPGEVTLTSTGRPGGLWRHRGRPPQALCGVGFAAQGWGRSEPYSRSEAAADPEWAWVFEGVDEDPIGAYGEVMGGAAGDEIDRVDRALGTPPQAVILASSRGHSNFYQRAIEEIPMNLPEHGGGEQDPEVHADIVYFRTPGGGEVFSTGSIAWSGALLHNKTDNGVSRMTENIVRAFVARRSG
ncbi:N,N-dimethylformamidase large subunit [Amycolatopsis rubida]|uniref:N,N-dimethylformamidase n=1 Tax=Amycolatopsis rubida TaxID=112413 RepID=A0A1I5ZFC3_9PSEU|nr:N,N-dimethylformamidase beta subunit family domain-containing protein [Amycolatopsis rubida]MYW92958.1 N,N-dimethylformamidase large subunit [Amycolatopsis rubida]NEC57945.1 N,N-dimethylformamidase large subunit [Amycolatopsis rubida]SFQ55148.1 N,N-dimethylformamidase [Amycolatopsis rubida]